MNPYAAVKRHCRGPLTKREGVVQKVNQYGDAGERVVEIQTAIFEEWCSFLNFFDSGIRFELSFMNMATDASNF